ncbi:ubiquinone-binding protein [Billgrantia gudaonensis]|uniref:Ubiquinone-binding protein n=1 Tax=Billgrantia gudaonensis TaxID=376427 RepID=A0A432JK69_9GAMM|nr:ubiquinone-binding protein [Halomonas gudaonensis]
MPTVNRSALVRHPPKDMFELVNDFERYRSSCRGVGMRLLERDDSHLIGEMTLGRAGIEQSFTTRNDLIRPSVSKCRWPFKRLRGRCLFLPMGENTCKGVPGAGVRVRQSPAWHGIRKLFQQVAGRLVDSFTRRADGLYGR